ncbi:hypothetical protein OX284_002835 [Flavobacterium sp. SUN046]|uniref:hypothetical protein n=1 Tax=Flavobacterium sp. SUN046 TaxID=3002440 RepID=UPI002DBE26E7|nr:hypothetical protein [Flavobacterium sp. SUN046]MEC4048351.1 hypothetical protein [Flavobacterium sp. SUN046]
MKTITLLVANILFIGNVTNAATIIKTTETTSKIMSYDYNEPISFMERGVAYYVFPNGDFDFNIAPQDVQANYYFRTMGRRSADRITDRIVNNYGVLIAQDNFGRICRIGNTFINYDYQNRVSRIGGIFIRYNQYALAQVGGLCLIYDNYGDIVNIVGTVKGYNMYPYRYPVNTYSYNYNHNNYHYNNAYGNGYGNNYHNQYDHDHDGYHNTNGNNGYGLGHEEHGGYQNNNGNNHNNTGATGVQNTTPTPNQYNDTPQHNAPQTTTPIGPSVPHNSTPQNNGTPRGHDGGRR